MIGQSNIAMEPTAPATRQRRGSSRTLYGRRKLLFFSGLQRGIRVQRGFALLRGSGGTSYGSFEDTSHLWLCGVGLGRVVLFERRRAAASTHSVVGHGLARVGSNTNAVVGTARRLPSPGS